MSRSVRAGCALLALSLAALAGCDADGASSGTGQAAPSPRPSSSATTTAQRSPTSSPTATASLSASPPTRHDRATGRRPLPGMPPVLDPSNVYAATKPGHLSPRIASDRPLVYVPNGISDTVDEIDPRTHRVIRVIHVGRLPQHVVPSWDLRTLWVTNDLSNTLTALDPRTGRVLRTVPVADPYNMYFTPNGRYAMVMAEALQRIDFRYPRTMRLHHALRVGCKGVDHGDFTADGRFFIASCEFAGMMVVVDVERQRVVRYVSLGQSNFAPQDVKLSPDGRTFFVADMHANGVWKIDARTWRVRGLLPTGYGAHGLYLSRDAKTMYVTNRGEGSIGLIDLRTGKLRAKWHIPPAANGLPASPDMGNLNAAGTVLWLSGRYSSEVYAIDTRTGRLIARIPTGAGPHGLLVWPQPGRYSLGHTGILR